MISPILEPSNRVDLIDINVLIYSHRADSPAHQSYANWLRSLATGRKPFALADVVLAGFLRVVTNQKIFSEPTPRGVAVEFCDSLLSRPNCVLLAPTPRQWPILVELCEQAKVTGPLVSDAYLAALALDHGCDIVSTDSDFSRFPGLRWRHPLTA